MSTETWADLLIVCLIVAAVGGYLYLMFGVW